MTTTLIIGNRKVRCRLIVFDKDGTLVDLRSVVLAKARARRDCIQKRAGKKISKLWERIVGVNLEAGEIDADGPLVSMTPEEEILIAAFSFYVNGYSWEESRKATRMAYYEAEKTLGSTCGAVLLAGVRDKLEMLKKHGFIIAVASNDKHSVIEDSFTALGIRSLCDTIVGSDDVPNGKPSPRMMEDILKRTGIGPEETVVVGDSIVDMKMGRNARVKACVAVLTGSGTRDKLEPLADVILRSLSELEVETRYDSNGAQTYARRSRHAWRRSFFDFGDTSAHFDKVPAL